MFRASLTLIFVITASVVFGQAGQRPVFKSKADSIQLAKIREVRAAYFGQKRDMDISGRQSFFDSLNKAELPLLRKATWQYVYAPRKSFTPFSDLTSGIVSPDSVKQLSISDVRSVRVPAEVLKCKNLEELELVNTRIDELQDELNSLPELTTIALYNNIPAKRLKLGANSTVNYLRIAGTTPKSSRSAIKTSPDWIHLISTAAAANVFQTLNVTMNLRNSCWWRTPSP